MSGTWWAFLVAVVVFGEGKRRGLGKGLSSYQLFRGVMDYLGGSVLDLGRIRAPADLDFCYGSANHDFGRDVVAVKPLSGASIVQVRVCFFFRVGTRC